MLATALACTKVLALLASGVLSGDLHLLAELHKLFELVARNLFNVAKLTSMLADYCVELYLFHYECCLLQVASNGKCTVVLEKECIMVLDIRHKRIGNFHCRGSAVLTGRNVSYCKNCLGEYVLVKLNACNSKCGSNRGMSVNNSVYVRTLSVYTEVHLDFGGGVELSFELFTCAINFDDHIGGKVAL